MPSVHENIGTFDFKYIKDWEVVPSLDSLGILGDSFLAYAKAALEPWILDSNLSLLGILVR